MKRIPKGRIVSLLPGDSRIVRGTALRRNPRAFALVERLQGELSSDPFYCFPAYEQEADDGMTEFVITNGGSRYSAMLERYPEKQVHLRVLPEEYARELAESANTGQPVALDLFWKQAIAHAILVSKKLDYREWLDGFAAVPGLTEAAKVAVAETLKEVDTSVVPIVPLSFTKRPNGRASTGFGNRVRLALAATKAMTLTGITKLLGVNRWVWSDSIAVDLTGDAAQRHTYNLLTLRWHSLLGQPTLDELQSADKQTLRKAVALALTGNRATLTDSASKTESAKTIIREELIGKLLNYFDMSEQSAEEFADYCFSD